MRATRKDAIIWTLNGGGFFIPVDNVTDIINRTGNAWGYRHLNTKFCIEEVWTDPERGNQHPARSTISRAPRRANTCLQTSRAWGSTVSM